MSIVVFLRGMNVGGHRTFRPSVLARELSEYGVVNVGAAGTFVVRTPGLREDFRAALLGKLPFEAEVVLCHGSELVRLETESPFGARPASPGVVRFVSVLAKRCPRPPSLPVTLPTTRGWFVRVNALKGRFVVGEYRRDMKTIGYLGRLDKLFGTTAITRQWKTILAIVRILKETERR